jgi:GLPGLI family protein
MKMKLGFTALLQLVLICALAFPATAQTSPTEMQSGHIRFLVTHNWTKRMSSLEYLSQQRKERMEYMYGKRSEWKQYTEMYFSPDASIYFESEESPDPEADTWSGRKDAYYIQRDFKGEKRNDLMTVLGTVYRIEDELGCQQWKILNDLKEVAGHICMSAYLKDTIKGQEIIAWFTTDIPSSAGPERYCGLPGMILEIDVNNGALVVSADKIEFKPIDAELLQLPKKPKGKTIKEEDYLEMLAGHIEEKKKAEQPWFWGMRY